MKSYLIFLSLIFPFTLIYSQILPGPSIEQDNSIYGCDPPITILKNDIDCTLESMGSFTIQIGLVPGNNYPFTGGLNQGPKFANPDFFFTNDITFENLAPGDYTYFLVDKNNCVFKGSFTIEQLNSDLTAEMTNNGCDFADVVVTGGSGIYIGPNDATQVEPGIFTFTNLPSGNTATKTFTDANNGCTIDVDIETLENTLNFRVDTMHADMCNGSNGSAEIIIFGGTPPYTGPFDEMGNPLDNIQTSNSGEFIFSNLDPAPYIWFFKDSKGCDVKLNFDISVNDNANVYDCSDINTGNNPYTHDSTYPIRFISGVKMNLLVALDAKCVPDRLNITVNKVNGDVEEFSRTAGSDTCDDFLDDFPYSTPQTILKYICIEPCDEVIINIDPDVCMGRHECESNSTGWELHLTCGGKKCF